MSSSYAKDVGRLRFPPANIAPFVRRMCIIMSFNTDPSRIPQTIRSIIQWTYGQLKLSHFHNVQLFIVGYEASKDLQETLAATNSMANFQFPTRTLVVQYHHHPVFKPGTVTMHEPENAFLDKFFIQPSGANTTETWERSWVALDAVGRRESKEPEKTYVQSWIGHTCEKASLRCTIKTVSVGG
ncbi:hypothetical protein CC86DRAFT_46190 [Ophiobolus disseminans]|uniref:Uncharacterized protein n=1 Tax=Ophiobolus disseminans TaxID=1469910 RepID=A0A6A6ZW68_9PLEO|nr:hypothetical protein CC86DRAFT_46190 [Ophiobolus disseminans]